jgi:RNA polymerase sigma factor (sigma-70 family)
LGRDVLLPGQALSDGAPLDLTALLHASPIATEARVTRSHPLESSAVGDVHDRRGRELFGLCRRLGLDDDEANDAVQETFLRMWAESVRGTVIVDPEGWAFRVAYRLAMDHHRLGRVARALAGRLLEGRVRDEIDPADRLAVWAAVDKLPPRQRAVLYLRYRADLSYERIAKIMGITANGARNDASAATAALRRRLAAEEGAR